MTVFQDLRNEHHEMDLDNGPDSPPPPRQPLLSASEPQVLTAQIAIGEELAGFDTVPVTDELRYGLEFVRALEKADLANGDLSEAQLVCLQSPIKKVLEINEPNILLSLKLFLSASKASEHVYRNICEDLNETNLGLDILSLDQVKKVIADLTGVLPIDHDMCPNSCIAYTGPFEDLKECPMCRESRYDLVQLQLSHGRKKVPRQHFYTMPLGPQLQALWQTH